MKINIVNLPKNETQSRREILNKRLYNLEVTVANIKHALSILEKQSAKIYQFPVSKPENKVASMACHRCEMKDWDFSGGF